MTNNQPGDKLYPKIQQELLNHLVVGRDLTVGNINQQNISLNIHLGLPPQQELSIDLIHQYIELVKLIIDARYTSEIHEVSSTSFTVSNEAEVIQPLCLVPTTTTFEFEVVTVDAQGRETKRCPKQAQYFVEILGDGVELEMVSIPGGKFTMGSLPEESESGEDERPRHIVTVNSFFMGKYPITQAQWRAIASLPKIKHNLDRDPSCFKGDNRPVERVNWYDAEEFCDRLSQKTRRFYRLPSEAEWEYACRAQTTTSFHFGKTITTHLANYSGQDQKIKCLFYKGTYGNEPNGFYRQETIEVDTFPANTFGLHDMHGNIWEWCADYYHKKYHEAPSDGSIWLINGNEEGRILRGGSWNSPPNICRSASRFLGNPSSSNKNIGFRVVCSFI